jgi:hypothetical protein
LSVNRESLFSFIPGRLNSIKKNTGIDFSLWKTAYFELEGLFENSVDLSAAGGFMSACPAFMFASGYQSALRYLFGPASLTGKIASFAITETGGGSPSAINTIMELSPDGALITGEKSFLTMGLESDIYFTAASEGIADDGRKKIKLVRIEKGAEGARLEQFELPFVKEISHARLIMKGVRVTGDKIYVGDGYSSYIKPFRTIEDIHLFASVCGYLMRCTLLHKWPREIFEEAVVLHTALVQAGTASPSAPEIIITVSGVKQMLDSLIKKIEPLWEKTGGPEADLWKRDSALFAVAKNVREKRSSKAWDESGLIS